MTGAQRRALRNAASRPNGNVCPVVGVHAAAETALLKALLRKRWITDGVIPYITQLGRDAIVDRQHDIECTCEKCDPDAVYDLIISNPKI